MIFHLKCIESMCVVCFFKNIFSEKFTWCAGYAGLSGDSSFAFQSTQTTWPRISFWTRLAGQSVSAINSGIPFRSYDLKNTNKIKSLPIATTLLHLVFGLQYVSIRSNLAEQNSPVNPGLPKPGIPASPFGPTSPTAPSIPSTPLKPGGPGSPFCPSEKKHHHQFISVSLPTI